MESIVSNHNFSLNIISRRYIDLKTIILNIYGALILLGLYACSDNSTTVADKPLVDTKWDMQSFEIVDVGKSDIGSQGMIIIFAENDSLEGVSRTIDGNLSMGGNAYWSAYEAGNNNSLYIDTVASTKVGSPEGSRYGEYLIALANSSAYEIEGDKLRIFYDERTRALNFKAE